MTRERRDRGGIALLQRSLASLWTSRRRRRAVTATLAMIVAAVAGGFVYMKLVERGFLRYNKWDRRVRGTLRVGQPAPDLELTRYDGSPLRLSTLWTTKPLVLVFGSCT